MNSVEVPQLLQSKFELNAEQLGLQFLGLIIGSLLGEQLGGVLSDTWMNLRAKRTGHKPEPEYRLWLSYIGYLLTIAGVVVFLVCTENAQTGKWNVRPIIGTGIGAFGNQVVTTVLITYAVDSYPADSGSVGVFINFIRSTWGFIGPFWYVILVYSSCIFANSDQVPRYVRYRGHRQEFRCRDGVADGRELYPDGDLAVAGAEMEEYLVYHIHTPYTIQS